MSAVPKSNLELEAALAEVNNSSDLREIMLAELSRQGQVVRTRDDAFNNHLVIRQPEPDASLPANGFRYEKEITFNPESGRRNLMIRANSMEDLTALENQILGRI
jgi:hypothetical protein